MYVWIVSEKFSSSKNWRTRKMSSLSRCGAILEEEPSAGMDRGTVPPRNPSGDCICGLEIAALFRFLFFFFFFLPILYAATLGLLLYLFVGWRLGDDEWVWIYKEGD